MDEHMATTAAGESVQNSDREYWQQERKKIIWDFLIFFAAVVIVGLAVWTAAWFASNKDVSGNNMAVSPQDTTFELKVVGENVGADVYDEVKEGDYASKLTDGVSLGDGYITDSANMAIKWRLADENGGSRLGPGSEGKLTFYVVPKSNGSFKVKFLLSIKAYNTVYSGEEEVMENVEEITSEAGYTEELLATAAYLDGHILFFRDRDSVTVDEKTTYSYRGLCKEGFDMLFDSVVKDEPQEVTLYWIWPYTFGQMVLPAESNGGRTAVTNDPQTQSDIRQYVIDHTATVFKDVEGDPREKMATLTEDVYYFDIATLQRESETGTNFEDLSLGYNKADHAIGTGIDYALLVLTAEQE